MTPTTAPTSSRDRSDRTAALAMVFSCLGHLYIHFCTAFYFVIVLALEEEWRMPYPELIELWTLGSLLVGVAALPAGLLSDRVGSGYMMAAFFLGMGGASIAAGLSGSPGVLLVALAGIGFFAAIYHPVGIPWLVRNSGARRGKVLGVNGVFGALGSALSGIVTGALVDEAGWRAAFFVPGLVAVVTGVVLVVTMRGSLGVAGPTSRSRADAWTPSRGDSRRVFGILLVTMFLAGLIFHVTQTALPKLFELRHDGLVSSGTFGVGVLVAIVYGAAGVVQVLGGHLADRFPLKRVYVGALLVQGPLLWLAAALGGAPLVLVAMLMVMANASALPAENMLLARYTPESRQGLVFGLKFVLSFGAAPLAVAIVSFLSRSAGGFEKIFVLASLTALVAFALAALLPRLRETAAPEPGAAAAPDTASA